MPFTSCGGCLKDIFITEAEIIDRYVGNQLWNWGNNSEGQLGTNTVVARSSPVQTVSTVTTWQQVAAGADLSGFGATAAIKTDGTLWLWGVNSSGMLGNNAVVARSSPVQTVSAGTNWKQVAIGNAAAGAIKTDGTLWLWGFNAAGQLGNNSTTNRSSPVQTVSGGTNWKQLTMGLCWSGAIKTDGTLWSWGSGSGGILGNNSTTDRSSPVQTVSGGTNWKQFSMGCRHAGAVKTDGTLWVWGNNCTGQLGTNTIINASSPVQTVSGGTNWKQVAMGREHSAAIKTDGTLWFWGTGFCGVLGSNSVTDRSSPVQTVSGGTNWKQVAVGNINEFSHTAAIKTDGTLWTWGVNGNGRLGDNTTVAKSSPVQTAAGGNYWKQVSAGYSHTAAVTFTEA